MKTFQPWHVRPEFFSQVNIAETPSAAVPASPAGAAIVPVLGVLARNSTAASYLAIQSALAAAVADAAVSRIVLLIDSPGGENSGALECAEAIAMAALSKPVVAYVEGQCCSSAYWLASHADAIIATPSSQVGCIGTILATADTSEAWRMEGMKLELFTSSQDKATGTDGKPWTDEDRAYLMERLQQADASIKSSIAAARPNIAAEAFGGRWYYATLAPGAPGVSALALGLIDETANSLDELLAALG